MGKNHQMEYNHTGKEYIADMGPSYTQVFTQELDNTNLDEYCKEPRPLTTESLKGVGSSPIKAIKPSPKVTNSTTYSDLREHEMVTPQKALLSWTKPGQGEENSRLITPNAPDQQNMYKSTCGIYNEDIVNISSSNNNVAKKTTKVYRPLPHTVQVCTCQGMIQMPKTSPI